MLKCVILRNQACTGQERKENKNKVSFKEVKKIKKKFFLKNHIKDKKFILTFVVFKVHICYAKFKPPNVAESHLLWEF